MQGTTIRTELPHLSLNLNLSQTLTYSTTWGALGDTSNYCDEADNSLSNWSHQIHKIYAVVQGITIGF